MAKKVLITGGAGFIGSNLSLKLLTKGYDVVVLDNLLPQTHGNKNDSLLYNSIKGKVEFIEADIRNREALRGALKGVNVVVHMAAETGTGQSMYETDRYVDVNCRGTAILLELLQSGESKVEKVVLSSSRAVYGEGKYVNKRGEIIYPGPRPSKRMDLKQFEPLGPDGEELDLMATDELSAINPLSIYAVTKFNQEQYIRIICAALGIPTVVFRYQNVYGPGQSLKNVYTGILSIFSTQLKSGNELNIFEDGLESRDFVFIDDVVTATILGIEKKEANNQVFNAGSGVATTVLYVAETLKKYYQSNTAIRVTGNYRVGDIRHNYADISKIQKQLGFEPSVNFDTGLQKFANWVNDQQIEAGAYAQSIAELKAKNLFK